MRRVIALLAAWGVAGLIPATSQADIPGLTVIGPPASLTTVVFASDGTAYGTVDRPTFSPRPLASPALWRSSDHGRTWSAVYRAPARTTLIVLGASRDVAYVQESDSALPLRIDAATGRATALPLGTFAGIDAAGTAYGITYDRRGTFALNRCPQAAGTCDALTLPAGFEPQIVVDPNSVGVLAVRLTAPVTGRFLLSSSDGGVTWAQAAPVQWNCTCPMAFAGPGSRTLYVMNGSDLSVSHTAGLTFDTVHASPNGISGIVVGSHPAAYVSLAGGTGFGGNILRTNDEGASFQALVLNESYPVVDPTDPAHFFMLHGDGWAMQSWDSGQSKSDVVDPRFGTTDVDPNFANGSGRQIYTSAPGASPSIWHSDDMGATWARTPIPAGSTRNDFRISRTNPRIAYTPGWPAGALRTFDGGAHWELLPDSRAILGIRAGEPYHLFAYTGLELFESVDAGTTWSPAPASAVCLLTAAGGGRIACEGSSTPLSSPPAFTFGLYDSPGVPGAYAVATGKLIGDLGSGWVLNSDLALTAGFGPQPALAQAAGVWADPGGSTFYAFDGTQSVVWVRRGSGRWWRLQAAGTRLGLVAPLDRTHALVRMTLKTAVPTTYEILAVLDLARPAVDPPTVRAQGNALACVVPWQIADAETSAYAWLRDGMVVPGATGGELQLRDADRGHDLSCRATARTDFGATTLTSSNTFRAPGTRVATRLRLTGSARFGKLLRCGATVRISWLRDGQGIKNRHARRYRVTAADEGHTLACQTKASDGTITRSVRLRVPRAHGGRSSALTP